jgi:isopenicillin-N N-acyltransferase-like protein
MIEARRRGDGEIPVTCWKADREGGTQLNQQDVADSQRRSIPLLRVSGSHREVGRQIGQSCASTIQKAVEFDARLPAGRNRRDQLRLAERYRNVTKDELPDVVDELDGVAEGACVDPTALFAASIEEIWTALPLHPGQDLVRGGCSDIVAGPAATKDGHLWVAHNNDLEASVEDDITAIEWELPRGPRLFTIGIGPWISVGWNARGLSLTGNELHPNDERVGIPRLLQVRDIVRQPSLRGAVRSALNPARASSYNNILAHRNEGVVSVEGSATDAALLQLERSGSLVHTNHYVDPSMQRYEADHANARRSAIRYGRLREMLDSFSRRSLTPAHLRSMLSDHCTGPDAVCRHPRESQQTKTVFWCVADVTVGAVTFGLGNPCSSRPQRYAFSMS